MRRPTLHDVARQAGVSKSTVSLVLQDSALVRAETRDRVRCAMERLDNVYNRSAANLRGPVALAFAAEVQMALSARGGAGRSETDERMAGYLEVMAETGQVPLIRPGPSSSAFGREVALRLARQHPEVDGAICRDDSVALGMLAGCAERGRAVGPGLRVVGFGGTRDCALGFPTLTTVQCDVAGLWPPCGCDAAGLAGDRGQTGG